MSGSVWNSEIYYPVPIKSVANQICDREKKKEKKKACNKKIQHRKSDKLLILLRIITVFTSR